MTSRASVGGAVAVLAGAALVAASLFPGPTGGTCWTGTCTATPAVPVAALLVLAVGLVAFVSRDPSSAAGIVGLGVVLAPLPLTRTWWTTGSPVLTAGGAMGTTGSLLLAAGGAALGVAALADRRDGTVAAPDAPDQTERADSQSPPGRYGDWRPSADAAAVVGVVGLALLSLSSVLPWTVRTGLCVWGCYARPTVPVLLAAGLAAALGLGAVRAPRLAAGAAAIGVAVAGYGAYVLSRTAADPQQLALAGPYVAVLGGVLVAVGAVGLGRAALESPLADDLLAR